MLGVELHCSARPLPACCNFERSVPDTTYGYMGLVGLFEVLYSVAVFSNSCWDGDVASHRVNAELQASCGCESIA